MEAHTLDVLHNQMPVLDALLTCVNMGWMSILVRRTVCVFAHGANPT